MYTRFLVILVAAMLTISSCKKSNDLDVSENKESQTNVSVVSGEINEFLTPVALTIEAHSQRGCPTAGSCWFISSGAISDAGTVETESIFWTAIPAPTVGTAHWVRTFIGAHGSITIQLETIVQATDIPYIGEEHGHWIILNGTGDYQGLQGEGDVTGIRNFLESKLDVVYNGIVH